MKPEKKIEIINNQIAKLKTPDFEHFAWLTETGNLLDLIFEKSDVKKHQLRSATNRPEYMLSGIKIERLIVDWQRLMEGYRYEIELLLEVEPQKENVENGNFIDEERISELEAIESVEYDFTKLVAICRELNSNYSSGNYLTVSMLCRAIIDHVPPIFSLNTFNEVSNNYGSKSFKKNMLNLNNSLRNIADSYLHQTIRKKETLPNRIQVDFKNDIDVLLAEIVRKSNE